LSPGQQRRELSLSAAQSKVDGDELWVVVADSARSVLARIAAARLARLQYDLFHPPRERAEGYAAMVEILS
jgi:2-C-methyl-D-erythritol 4-phosphate cytidylyltransferase